MYINYYYLNQYITGYILEVTNSTVYRLLLLLLIYIIILITLFTLFQYKIKIICSPSNSLS